MITADTVITIKLKSKEDALLFKTLEPYILDNGVRVEVWMVKKEIIDTFVDGNRGLIFYLNDWSRRVGIGHNPLTSDTVKGVELDLERDYNTITQVLLRATPLEIASHCIKKEIGL